MKVYRVFGVVALLGTLIFARESIAQLEGGPPMDRPFSQFTDEQKQAYKRMAYEGMAEDESPPWPKEGMNSVHSAMESAGANRILSWPRGELFAIVTVSPEGKAMKVEVFQSPSIDATKVASYVLMNTEYEAAECQGNPCQGEFLWHVKYK